MTITATAPARISLFGGGTDVNPYAEKYQGVVINMAITLRQHITLYTDEEMWHIAYNTYPFGADKTLFNTIREVYGIGGMHGSRVKSRFDGYIGAGLGSSASASVALLAAIKKLRGEPLDRLQLASLAHDIEVNQLGWHGGMQDQLAAAYGGLNYMEIGKNMHVAKFSESITQELLPYLTLFYIGGSRKSASIQKNFKTITPTQKYLLDKIKALALQARTLLIAGKYAQLGFLLDKAWNLKRESNSGVTTPHIDRLYEKGIKNGAYGGKIIGAGGAGYMLFFIPPNLRQKFISKMEHEGISWVDFGVDLNGVEARIV